MKSLILIFLFALYILLLSGCAKKDVAMNLYTPNQSKNAVESSSISVEITKDMLKKSKRR